MSWFQYWCPDCVGDFSISSMQAERIRFSGLAPIPRLSLFPRFQRFICMGKYYREFQMPRTQRFPYSRCPDSRGYTVLHYVHITPLALNQNCVLIPCPTLVILCTNLPYPNEVLYYVYISPLPLNQNCVIIPCPTLLILSTNLPHANEVLHYVYISPLPLNQNCIILPCQVCIL